MTAFANSYTHYQIAPADTQAKTWQRVCLFQLATDRQSGRKKNTERTTAVTVAQLPLNSKKANYVTLMHVF
jgi:hypothetical protein